MILTDTSIWIDHLHGVDELLEEALNQSRVAQHSMIIGELALGRIRNRDAVLGLMSRLPGVQEATHDEVMTLVRNRGLDGQGLSLVDAHLLASVALTPGTRLWTRDKRLRRAAGEMGIDHPSP